MKKLAVLLFAFTVLSLSFAPDSIAITKSWHGVTINYDDYDIVLRDSDGDYYGLNLVKSIFGFEQYAGKNVTIKGIKECTILYNIEEKEITLAANFSDNTPFSPVTELPQKKIYFGAFKYSSPDLFKGIYTWLYIGWESREKVSKLELYVKKGVFPGLPSAKITSRNQDMSLQQEDDPGVLKLGALIPMSGDLQSLGEAYEGALQLAQEDALEYLGQTGGDLSVELFVEDNQTDPGESYYRIQDLRSQGVSIFLGPQDSDSVQYMKQFADAENYLLLSSASTAVGLSLPNDNVMRCISDDTHQAAALIDRALADGVTDLYIVARTNLYGYDFYEALERGFTEKGGAVKSFLYSKPVDIEDTVQELITEIGEQASTGEEKKTGVVLISFDEGIEVLELAAESPEASGVQWYGTDSLAQNGALIKNSAVAEFAAKTNFTCTTFGRPDSEAFRAVEEKLTARLGFEPPTTALLVYDALQLAVRAYDRAGTNDPAVMKAALRDVAETYEGITGSLRFNENGDRAEGMYDFWTVTEDNGLYFWQSDSGEQWSGDPVSVQDWMMVN